MNHFISGILKIILLEGSIALLLIDAVAKDRFTLARARAHGVLAGLMVFAWANWGMPRGNIELSRTLASIPIILLCGFAVGFAFSKEREQRLASLRDWLTEDATRARTWGAVSGLVVSLTVSAVFDWLPAVAPGESFLGANWLWFAVTIALMAVGARFARRAVSLESSSSWVKNSKPLAIALTVILSAGWVGVGVSKNKLPLIHNWEQFHFYLGAKYQAEVGWFNLYKATIIADRETVNVLGGVGQTRDLTTFEQVPITSVFAEADAVKSRFAPERWEAFKADWVQMTRLWNINWTNVINDHGNSNSPAWAILAAPLTRIVPLTYEGQALLGWIDMLLMLGLWLTVWQVFGHRVASIGLFMWAAEPIVFDYLAGSILRWDWLFAVGMAACFIKLKKYDAAGAFFGFALATKLFPLFFGVALGIRAIFVWRTTKKFETDYVKFLRSTVIAGAVTVALSTAMFGVDAWKEYAQRIQVTQTEKFYSIQYSLKTVFLQHAANPVQTWAQTIFPGDLAQRRNEVDIKDFGFSFLLARLAFTALVILLLRRANDVEAFVMGPLLVFAWLTVNMYYWNMLGLLAMGLAMRAEKQRPALGMLIGFHAIFMIFYLYQHLNRGLTEGYAVAWMITLLTIVTAWWEWIDSNDEAEVTG
ncbi:MAG: hypothetical protein ACO1OB_14760 [Archangium sp.]